MNPNDLASKPLPAFRADLQIFRGPDEADGSPSYNIYDPLRSIYFKISWAELAILQNLRGGMTIKELLQETANHSTLRVSMEEVAMFFIQLESQGLTEGYRDSAKLSKQSFNEKPGWIMWFLFNYLFVKIPLFNPNRFLDATLPYVLPFMSRQALIIYLCIGVVGFSLLLTRWAEFIHTFSYFFNIEGVIAYSCAIIVTKVIHELSHAYTAKRFGLHIPTMGIAILVLWPVLYTDATDAWRLHNRKQRLLISAAGVIAELVLAGFATILWSLSEPGLWQSVFFIVASLNWLSTLAINLNPAMRFDGYYLLSDLLGVENLQSRAFMLLRYTFYQTVAGAQLPDLEPHMTKARKRWMVFYAIYTWAYRLFLYTAIALFVYNKFTKAVGVFLFILEIAVFFIWPIIDEIIFYRKIRQTIKWNFRLKLTSFALTAFLLWFIVPWPVHVKMTAITVPTENQPIYAPSEGLIDKLYVTRQQSVKKGDPILWIRSPEIENKIAILEKEIQITKKQIDITQLTDKTVPFYMEKELLLTQTQAELDGYRKKKEQNLVTAKLDGVLYQWDDYLREGLPIGNKQLLVQIAPANSMEIIAFIDESEVHYLTVGDHLTFKPKNGIQSYDAEVLSVSPVRADLLQYTQLASLYGGDLPVNPISRTQLKMIKSYYTVKLKVDTNDNALKIGRTGYVKFWGPWRSRGILLIEYIFSVALRQSGF